jgi:hypothetical protein
MAVLLAERLTIELSPPAIAATIRTTRLFSPESSHENH